MKKLIFSILFLCVSPLLFAQGVMSPELLWSLGQVSVRAVAPDGKQLIYAVSKTNLKTEAVSTEYFLLHTESHQQQAVDFLQGRSPVQWDKNGLYTREGQTLYRSSDLGKTWTALPARLPEAAFAPKVSPDGQYIAYALEVKQEDVLGKEIYNDVDSSTAHIYTDLNYRHWDSWSTGKVNHVFILPADGSGAARDILSGKPYDCPQKPFGGGEDFIFTPDSRGLLYVTKEKTGKEYAQSTNTDIFHYTISTAQTRNLTEGRMGYDVAPAFSPDGKHLAWKSMKRDGYEADKNDLIIQSWPSGNPINLTTNWDETVDGDYHWSADNKRLYFSASYRGTQQLFSIEAKTGAKVRQLTEGAFNVGNIYTDAGKYLITDRTDFNHARELFSVKSGNGEMTQVSQVNDSIYQSISLSRSELKMVKTKDGKDMGVWVIYPPNFDPAKKYPTLLYCQGGPQSALSQFYSIRWNFQLMAAEGYIIVAPNRRGMPGWGVAWNEAISKDWGGGPMDDYLSAIDALAAEPYVDNNRLGCVGASYGGYSVFMLAGIHQNRFKSFIAHDGLFDMKSWYGTTEELWFANWDLGGNYWQEPTPESYEKYNPSNFVSRWNTPILIIQGGLDFRVGIEQGLEAFQAAQLKGVKSKLLYFPDENHWILHPHNGLVWQREFFKWLEETL